MLDLDSAFPPIQQRILGRTLTRTRAVLLLILLATVAAAACTMAGPLIFAEVVSRISAGRSTAANLIGALLLFALVFAAARAFSELTYSLLTRVEHESEVQTYREALNEVLRARGSFFVENNPAGIAMLIAKLNESNRSQLNLGCIALLGSAISILFAAGAVAAYVDWTVAACVLVYGLVSVWLILRSNNAARLHQVSALVFSGEGANTLGNLAASAGAIRSFRAQRWAGTLLDRYMGQSQARWNEFQTVWMRYSLTQSTLLFIQYGTVFALVVSQPVSPEVLAGQVVMVSMVLVQLNRPFEMIANALRMIAMAREQARPIQRALDRHPPAAVLTDGQAVPGQGPLVLQLDQVSYRYADHPQAALAGATARFSAGRLNFIVGPSGAGKSTLFAILLRHAEDHGGTIAVGEPAVELDRIDENAWLDAIAHVPQEPVLMNLSIRENVAFGRDLTDPEARAMLAAVHLGDKLASLPEGLDFIIGERGQRLSVGERQRLAIARALIGRPRLLLLDEASSALDEGTERGIFTMLRELADATTIIAVTHRLAVITPDDHVLTIKPAGETDDESAAARPGTQG